jgi:small multidrug resistance pump
VNTATFQYAYVALAVVADAAGATALKAADGLRVPIPALLAFVAYGGAFYFLALAVRTIPIGVANALWSGCSILLVALVGLIVHRQSLDRMTIVGMMLIFLGTVVLNWGANPVRP